MVGTFETFETLETEGTSISEGIVSVPVRVLARYE